MLKTVLSLGSINADFQVRVDAAPGSQETLLAHDFRRFSGGKAANTAYIAACFGCRSVLLGRVGDDELAAQALAALVDKGVEVEGVGRAAGCATGVSMIAVPPGAKKQIVLATNANDEWDDDASRCVAERIARAESPALLVADYEIPARVVREAIETAYEHKVPVVLDPSFPQRVEHGLLEKLEAITPNVAEAEVLLGEPLGTPGKAARGTRQFHDAGVRVACIKLADGGCVLTCEGDTVHVPPGNVTPVDTTGAGDAFTAVLAVSLLEGCPPVTAAARAVAAANLAVTGYGSQPAYPSRAKVASMAAQLLEGVRRVAG